MSDTNPSTLLELTQRLAREAAVNGITPSTTLAQTGESQRLGNWIVDAWREIQGSRLWHPLWEKVDIVVPDTLSSVQTDIPPSRWDKSCTWLIPVSSDNGDRELDYIEWREFDRTYRRLGNTGAITAWTVRPDNKFVVNAPASGATTINVQRWKNPQMLALDTDVPWIPADLTMLIVYAALKKYAGYDEAGVQRSVAVDEMKTLRAALYERCLPELTLDGTSLLDIYG